MRVSPAYWKLLVVRAVHVTFRARTTARCASRCRGCAANLCRAALETRLALERIAGIDAAQVVDGERRGFRSDGELYIAVRAPPQRPEQALGAAVGEEDVLEADEFLAFDLVAVVLAIGAGHVQRLCVAMRTWTRRPAADHQFRISRGEVLVIEQQRGGGPGRNRQARNAARRRR